MYLLSLNTVSVSLPLRSHINQDRLRQSVSTDRAYFHKMAMRLNGDPQKRLHSLIV